MIRLKPYLIFVFVLVMSLLGCQTTTTTATSETTVSTTTTTTSTVDPSDLLRAQAQADADVFMETMLQADRLVIDQTVSITVTDNQNTILANSSSSISQRYNFVDKFEEAVILTNGVKNELLAITLEDYYLLTFFSIDEEVSANFTTTDITPMTSNQDVALMYEYVYLPFGRNYSEEDGLYSFDETGSSSASVMLQTMTMMMQMLSATQSEIANAVLHVTTGFFASTGEMVFRVEIQDMPIQALSGTVDASLELIVSSPEELVPSGMFSSFYENMGAFSYEDVTVTLEADVWYDHFFISTAPSMYFSVWLEPGIYLLETKSDDIQNIYPDFLGIQEVNSNGTPRPYTYVIETAGRYYYAVSSGGTGFASIRTRKLDLVDVGDINNLTPLEPETIAYNEGVGDFQLYHFEDEREGFIAITIEYVGEGELHARAWHKTGYSWIQETVDGNVYLFYPKEYKLEVEVSGDYVGEYIIHADFTPKPTQQSNPTNSPALMLPITSEFGDVIYNGKVHIAPNYSFYVSTAGTYRLDLSVIVGSPIVELYNASMVEIQDDWNGDQYLAVGYYIVHFSFTTGWDVNAFYAKLTQVVPN